ARPGSSQPATSPAGLTRAPAQTLGLSTGSLPNDRDRSRRATCWGSARTTMPCRSSGASTTTCRLTTSVMPTNGTRLGFTAALRAGTVSSNTAATAASWQWRRSIATSRTCRPNWRWSETARERASCPNWRLRTCVMARFKIGDRVSWNSEAGRVRGRIVRVHTKDVNYKGYVHHASREDPQYEIKSEKTDHVALHKGRALRRLSR